MKLDFIPLDKLSVSKANMRFSKSAPDVSDILPTVRKRGVIQPIIVRPQSCPEPVEGRAPDAPWSTGYCNATDANSGVLDCESRYVSRMSNGFWSM